MISNRQKQANPKRKSAHNKDVFPFPTDPAAARAYLESIRWPNGPVCPHCGHAKVYAIERSGTSTVRPGLYKCAACRRQFTVTLKTVLDGTRLPLQTWIRAVELLCQSRRGLTVSQLCDQLQVSYQTAWKILARVRDALGRPVLRNPPVGQPRPESLHPRTVGQALLLLLSTVPARQRDDRLERQLNKLSKGL